jgi:hypothetical protein
MASIHKFSDQVIDYAERLSDMADAAEGKGTRKRGRGTRLLMLPAAGAGLFALIRSDFFSRQAKGVVEEAKTRASDLPEDLLSHVRQTSQKSRRSGTQRSGQTSSAQTTGSGSARRTGTGRKRSSARKRSAARSTSSAR